MSQDLNKNTPHSLGKLIEWKHKRAKTTIFERFISPLAGETN